MRWYAKEVHLKKAMNINNVNDNNLERLRTQKRGKKFISNTPSYDILFNIKYSDMLFYQDMD